MRLQNSLEGFIHQKFSALPPSKGGTRDLSIGLEHEFFLLDDDGLPATHEESQEIFRRFAEEPGWHIHDSSPSELGEMINRVSLDHAPGRYTALKYDHHPHLLEIAFSYYSTLHELHERIQRTFEILSRVSSKSGVVAAHVPMIGLRPDDQRLQSSLQDFVNLRHYRALILKNRSDVKRPEYFNYAAVIAATQTHIGGTGWWDRPGYLSALYSLEPDMLGWSLSALQGRHNPGHEILKKRWEGYSEVFSGFPLVGFPEMTDCKITDWAHALLNSPLYGGPKDYWAGKTAWQLNENPYPSWDQFWKSVRDLQIIRPKLYGTLEFRADPAQPDPESIIRIAAIRLGICSYLLSKNSLSEADLYLRQMSDARTSWWQSVTSGYVQISDHVLDIAAQGLRLRGLKEESLLRIC